MLYESLILLLPNCRYMVQLHSLAHAQFVGKVHHSETKFEKGAEIRPRLASHTLLGPGIASRYTYEREFRTGTA